MKPAKIILGAGVTGLAAGVVSGLPVYEAEDSPGGICSSYYMRPGEILRRFSPPEDGEAYRFEIGGGHWIFGADSDILGFIESFSKVRKYERRSAVYLPEFDLYVPYPIQNHLSYLPKNTVKRALGEILQSSHKPESTMAEWLSARFGQTLCELFFFPFHELYTASLYQQIAPQDQFKSPVNNELIIKGAQGRTPAVGYNAIFIYPVAGLNELVQRMAERCRIHFDKRVVSLDLRKKTVLFRDGTTVPYDRILSTLPLNRMLAMTGVDLGIPPGPYTSVLVLNIGARRGPHCPEDHWLYIPRSSCGFHRVGFYSNVEPSFLPFSSRNRLDRVSIYVERSYPGGEQPDFYSIQSYQTAVIQELQSWGFIERVEVVDPTWIPIAYTWSYPGSDWRTEALKMLADHNIYQTGRYARWKFQGIAESIRDGRWAGENFKN